MVSSRLKHWFFIVVVVFLIACQTLTISDTTLGEYITTGMFARLREEVNNSEDIQAVLTWLHNDQKFDISEQVATFDQSRKDAKNAKQQRDESASFETPIDKAQDAKTYFDELIEACKGQNAYCDQKALETGGLSSYSTRK
jgi:hypothetical protein